MRRTSIRPIVALIGLGSVAVLGSSTNVAESFFEYVKSNPASVMFWASPKDNLDENRVKQSVKAQKSDILDNSDSNPTQTEIPEYVLYDRMFSLIGKVRIMADEKGSRGEEISQFDGYFQREANLNESEGEILQGVSVEYVQAVKIVDDQAETVIEVLRLQHPVELLKGELIKPSAELMELQERRNELALHYRRQLSNLLEHNKF